MFLTNLICLIGQNCTVCPRSIVLFNSDILLQNGQKKIYVQYFKNVLCLTFVHLLLRYHTRRTTIWRVGGTVTAALGVISRLQCPNRLSSSKTRCLYQMAVKKRCTRVFTKIFFLFATAVDLNKCFTQIKSPISELPSYISTMIVDGLPSPPTQPEPPAVLSQPHATAVSVRQTYEILQCCGSGAVWSRYILDRGIRILPY